MKDSFKKYAWISFGIIFSTIIISAIALYFLAGDITARASAIAGNRLKIVNQYDDLASYAEIKRDAPEAAQYKTAMDELLPTQEELIQFPQWLETTAGTYNVTTDFSFGAVAPAAASTTPGTAAFSLTVQGKNDDIISFLTYLESRASGFLLSFDSFDFSESDAGVKATVDGQIYFR
jgi:hypothetical protein